MQQNNVDNTSLSCDPIAFEIETNSEFVILQKKLILWKSKFLQLFFRSSRPEVFFKKGVLKNFGKFTGKHLCQSLFFNKVAEVRPETLLKKRLWHRCFPLNFVKFLRTPLVAAPVSCFILNKFSNYFSYVKCFEAEN